MPAFSNTWVFWALLSALAAALTAVLAKIGVRDVDPDLATFFRTLVIAVLLGLLVLANGKAADLSGLTPRSLLFLLLSALATGASWLCYFRALKLGEAFKVAPVDKLSVVMTAVLAFMFLGERPSVREWCGIGLIGAGVLLLALRR